MCVFVLVDANALGVILAGQLEHYVLRTYTSLELAINIHAVVFLFLVWREGGGGR